MLRAPEGFSNTPRETLAGHEIVLQMMCSMFSLHLMSVCRQTLSYLDATKLHSSFGPCARREMKVNLTPSNGNAASFWKLDVPKALF